MTLFTDLPTIQEELAFLETTSFWSYLLPVLWIILGGIFLFVFLRLMQKMVRSLNRMNLALHRTTFKVSVPKIVSNPEELKNKNLKEIMAACEVVLINLGAVKWRETSNVIYNAWMHFWFGETMHISLEVVSDDGLINFYVNCPKVLAEFVEKQLYSQYPDADIEEVDDYNLFRPNSKTWGCHLKLAKEAMYPIRTYKKLEADPLNSTLSVLSKLEEQESAAIQIIIRPAKSSWQKRARHVASTLLRGKRHDVVGQATTHRGVMSGASETLGMAGSMIFGEKKSETIQPGIPQLTPMEQELLKSIEEKSGQNGYETVLLLLATSPQQEKARLHLERLVNAFIQYRSTESGQEFKRLWNLRPRRLVNDFIFRHFRENKASILTPDEITSIWHLPLPQTDIPNINWLLAKKASAPVNVPAQGLRLGFNMYRGVKTVIRIKPEDRRRHMYIIGRSGSGKSVLMANMAIQDIKEGHGVAVIDPHGDLVEDILPFIPKERAEDVIIFNPADIERPLGLNMLEFKTQEQKDFVVQEMIAIFYKLFGQEMIGPMFEHYMRNAMLALLEDDDSGATLVEIPRMFTDAEFRKSKLRKVQNQIVKNFWEQEYEQSQRGQQSADMLSYVISKIGRFLTNDMMRNIIGQVKSSFDFRDVMDNKKILLVNLSKGVTGEVNANLLGMILVTKLQVAALGRATMPQEQRTDFYLYIDEFQNFITESIATILSEARKYKLNLIIAHQYVGQLVVGTDTKIRDAIFGNVGTMCSFRIGVEDAEVMAKQYAPVFNEYDVQNIPKYSAYVKLLIDNTVSPAFNMHTDPPQRVTGREYSSQLKELSRYKFGRDRRITEMEILERSRLGESPSGTSTYAGMGASL